MQRPLPAELIDHIFSFLRKYPSALKACSKAHPLYSRLAERHLYAYIVVDPLAPDVSNSILENPRLLNYPRTLQITSYFNTRNTPLMISIMSVIPRMANLVSLTMTGLLDEEIILAFRNCIQQSSFQELHLDVRRLPLSILDDVRHVKHLTLSNCSPKNEEISNSSPSQLSLETLVLFGNYYRPSIHLWAMRWVTHLTSLELHLSSDLKFSELLAACSNSLTNLVLDMGNWDGEELPFTLSALKHLKKLSIYVMVVSPAIMSDGEWALPEIIRVVNTTLAMPDVVLQFYSRFSNSITSLAQLDWSPLNHLKSNMIGNPPRIDLCLPYRTLPETVQGALAANEVLNDLVKQGLVINISSFGNA